MDVPHSLLTALVLIITSGIFSLFDFALASCRKTRLEKESSKRCRSLLKVLENPLKLSFTCRLLINILRILAAIFTGMAVMRYFEVKHISHAVIIIVVAASAFALGILAALIGDGFPKLISRLAPEKTAAALLPLINFFYFILIPFILPALKISSFFRSALNIEASENNMTEDELRHALLEGEKSGIVETKERSMVEGVFYLGDRPVGAFMTHRSEVQCLDYNLPYDEIREKAIEFRKQRCFPVINKSHDEIAGAVYLEDIILDTARPEPQGLRAIMKKAQFVPETMSALKAFEAFKQGQADFLFVMDEYGGLAGVIPIRTLVEEIVGKLSIPTREEEPLKLLDDGSWLADGTLNIDDAAQALSLTGLPEEDDFHTLAGFILFLAGELPKAGDSFEYQGYRFTVKEMDGNRIDKILIAGPRQTFRQQFSV